MNPHVENGSVPAVVSAVHRAGQTRVEAEGVLSIGGPPVTETSIFRIASLSKPVTAVAAMVLVEDGALALDDAVDPWLPELASRRVLRSLEGDVEDTVPASRPISVRDVLTFTSGYGLVLAPPHTYPIQKLLPPDGHPRPQDMPPDYLERLRDVPLLFQPGEQWAYNTSSDLLGALIARVSARPLEVFLSERIFEPLGMHDTGFSVPAQHLDRLTTHYARTADGALAVFDPPEGQWSAPPAFPSGAGGLVSTVPDYLRFARMMLAGGTLDGERILRPATVAAMTANQLTDAQRARTQWMPGYFDDWGWGFGLAVRTRRTGPEQVGQYGWDGGTGATWYADPRAGMTGVQLTTVNWESPVPPPVCRDFWAAAYERSTRG